MYKLIYTTTLTLIFYIIFCGSICFGNSDDVIELFNETQAVIYGIWWVSPNQKVASIKGNIADLDLLILDLRSSVIHGINGYNSNPPSYPFQFDEKKLMEVKDELYKNNQVVNDSIEINEDNWGVNLSFKLKKYNNYEIRRYPAYIIVLSDKISVPVKNKADYKAVLNDIYKIISTNFATKTELSELMESYDEKFSTLKQPMYLVTHLYVDYPSYLNFMAKGRNIDKFWSEEELINMGVLPHKDFYFHLFDNTFFASIFKHSNNCN